MVDTFKHANLHPSQASSLYVISPVDCVFLKAPALSKKEYRGLPWDITHHPPLLTTLISPLHCFKNFRCYIKGNKTLFNMLARDHHSVVSSKCWLVIFVLNGLHTAQTYSRKTVVSNGAKESLALQMVFFVRLWIITLTDCSLNKRPASITAQLGLNCCLWSCLETLVAFNKERPRPLIQVLLVPAITITVSDSNIFYNSNINYMRMIPLVNLSSPIFRLITSMEASPSISIFVHFFCIHIQLKSQSATACSIRSRD